MALWACSRRKRACRRQPGGLRTRVYLLVAKRSAADIQHLGRVGGQDVLAKTNNHQGTFTWCLCSSVTHSDSILVRCIKRVLSPLRAPLRAPLPPPLLPAPVPLTFTLPAPPQTTLVDLTFAFASAQHHDPAHALPLLPALARVPLTSTLLFHRPPWWTWLLHLPVPSTTTPCSCAASRTRRCPCCLTSVRPT